MKVLFLHPNTPDYLSAGLFHGLRSLLGNNCVDLPRFDCMYKPFTEGMRSKIRGKGFTLYGLLDDIAELAEERFYIWQKNIKSFDLYIVADIWNNWQVYNQLKQIVPIDKIIVIDPGDTTRVFPFNNYKRLFSTEKARLFTGFSNKTKYYKRELTGDFFDYTGVSIIGRPIPKPFMVKDIRPIHFSIPAEKIHPTSLEQKTKMFTNNIVDAELSMLLNNCHFIPLRKEQYNFEDEESYYNDIRQSKYGITIKRSGWDCLRHYEFAANGAVLCFKNLDIKPHLNAPHGLNDTNCIIYHDYADLLKSIESIDDNKYTRLLENSYLWITKHTTTALASKIITDK